MNKLNLVILLFVSTITLSSFSPLNRKAVEKPFSVDEAYLGMSKKLLLSIIEIGGDHEYIGTEMYDSTGIEKFVYKLKNHTPISKELALGLFFKKNVCNEVAHIVKTEDVSKLITWLSVIDAERINTTTWESKAGVIYTIERDDKDRNLSKVSYAMF